MGWEPFQPLARGSEGRGHVMCHGLVQRGTFPTDSEGAFHGRGEDTGVRTRAAREAQSRPGAGIQANRQVFDTLVSHCKTLLLHIEKVSLN